MNPWLTIKSASCPLCKHDCSLDLPKSETEQQQQQPSSSPQQPPPPPSYSFFSLRSSQNNSPVSSFGPTIAADRAEEFSRSWMARSLPRNMRRQIHEAAQAAAEANRESVIELPARMTESSALNQSTSIDVPSAQTFDTQDTTSPPPLPPSSSSSSSQRFGNRLRRTLPRFWRSNATEAHA
ncbi:hypothetical protein HPULCUR_005126 [Helicostylum pulchrum]|uniref:R3H domain-containing protein n=1 Tax=Helicostylum pulchrum TaxID=562976 RepID=A0ABP9XY74_9FUNG